MNLRNELTSGGVGTTEEVVFFLEICLHREIWQFENSIVRFLDDLSTGSLVARIHDRDIHRQLRTLYLFTPLRYADYLLC